MNWSWRKGKAGQMYRSYMYYDAKLGTNVRLKKEVGPQFESDADATAWCGKWEAEHDAARVRIARRIEAESKFHNFEKFVETFEKDMKQKAPNSWDNTMSYLRLYVLPFFLGEKGSNNLHNWPLHYAEFKDWLQEVEKVRGRGKLSGQSRNLAITALNNFLKSMKLRGELTGTVETCPQFSSSTTYRRGAKAVIPMQDRVRIYDWLLENRGAEFADFFDALLEFGMRISELIGISLADVHESDLIADRYKQILEFYGIEYFGYVYLESQPKQKAGDPRAKDGSVPRKPLKWQKRISPECSRSIPVRSKRVWNMLVNRWEIQKAKFDRDTRGLSEKDHLLFEGMTKARFGKALTDACEALGIRVQTEKGMETYTPHCCRHTCSTDLAALAKGNKELSKIILGHKSEKEINRYIHLAEEIGMEQHAKQQFKRGLKRA